MQVNLVETFEEAEAFQTLQKATIIACLIGWSLPVPVPTWETVEDLSSQLYKALEDATKKELNVIIEGVDFDPPAPNSPGFEGSPIAPSDGSAAGSRADQESQSIESQPNGGPSTDTAAPSPA